MWGWKLVGVLEPGYVSLFPRRRENALPYFVGAPTSAPAAPLFLFADAVTGAQIAGHMNSSAEMAVLRVEATNARPLRYCAELEADIAEFWETVLAGQEWPLARSFACWPHTHVADALTPGAVAWQGRRVGDVAAEVQRGMDAARGVVQAKPSLWFPTISRQGAQP